MKSTLNIENLSKLEALLLEYWSDKAVFDERLDQLLYDLDESGANQKKEQDTLLKEANSVSDTLATYEGKVKASSIVNWIVNPIGIHYFQLISAINRFTIRHLFIRK